MVHGVYRVDALGIASQSLRQWSGFSPGATARRTKADVALTKARIDLDS
jgi:hypothetical protein